MLIVDGHLDLAMNALNWNRDLKLPVHETRRLEEGMEQKGRAAGTVAFPELRSGNIGLSLATVITRVAHEGSVRSGVRTHEMAYALSQGMLAYYRELERQGVLAILETSGDLKAHVDRWNADQVNTPLGIVLTMEGADPIVEPSQVESWWNQGMRAVSLSHYGPSKYAMGTETPGGLTPDGPELLREMDRIGMILDVTHFSDDSFWEAVDIYQGQLIATHSNARALVPGDRQLTDDMIRVVVERDGVIGAAFDAWMLEPGWVRGVTQPDRVTIGTVVDHIDHVCQVAGNARHAAIGTDLDGGYGTEQCPNDLDTIADLQKIPDILRTRGYSDDDIANIMHGNWLRVLGNALPA